MNVVAKRTVEEMASKGRFEPYETHPGRYGVYDHSRRGHLPFEFGSPEEAISEARRITVEAARTGRSLYLIDDEDANSSS